MHLPTKSSGAPYFSLLFPLIVLFATGYFVVILLYRFLLKKKFLRPSDFFAQIAGALGLIAGFIFFGVFGFNRFAFASEQTRMAWIGAGYNYEMGQSLFSGFVCSLFLIGIDHFLIFSEKLRSIMVFIVVFFVSFVSFVLWPIFVSLQVR